MTLCVLAVNILVLTPIYFMIYLSTFLEFQHTRQFNLIIRFWRQTYQKYSTSHKVYKVKKPGSIGQNIKRRIWNIPPRTHNNLVSNVTDNRDTIIEMRKVQFMFNSRNHSNSTYKNVLRVKLLSVNPTFAANNLYLSFKVMAK